MLVVSYTLKFKAIGIGEWSGYLFSSYQQNNSGSKEFVQFGLRNWVIICVVWNSYFYWEVRHGLRFLVFN